MPGEPGCVYALGLRRQRHPDRASSPLVGASGDRAPNLPTWVGDPDTQALSDTGSVVTLLRPDLADGRAGEPMEVSCVHGDTRTPETCHVFVRTPRGAFTVKAGIVPSAPTDWERLPHLPPVMERRARTQTGPTAAEATQTTSPTRLRSPGTPLLPTHLQTHLERETSLGETAPHHQAHQPTGPARPPAWNQPRPPTP